ncbi:MAG TPA: hypothetical protein VFP35_03235 [Candidatus Saccharimonadales bacterium]|nr:hypothetical protein [Candidatus Saccharimonadales bacterium]
MSELQKFLLISLVLGVVITFLTYPIKGTNYITKCIGIENYKQTMHGIPLPFYYQKYSQNCLFVNANNLGKSNFSPFEGPPQGINKIHLVFDAFAWGVVAFAVTAVFANRMSFKK